MGTRLNWSHAVSRDSSTTSSTRPRVRRTSSGGASETRCDSEPAPAQTVRCRSIVRSTRMTETRSSGNGATAPGRKPVAASTSSGSATVARRAPTSRATFPVSTLRSPGTSVTTGDASHMRTIDFTTWPSVQPTASAAACAVAVGVGSSSIRASAPVSRRNAATRSTGSGHSMPFAVTRARRSGRRRSPRRAAGRRARSWPASRWRRPSAPRLPPSSARPPCWRC